MVSTHLQFKDYIIIFAPFLLTNSPRLYTPSPRRAARPRKKACCSCSLELRSDSSTHPKYLYKYQSSAKKSSFLFGQKGCNVQPRHGCTTIKAVVYEIVACKGCPNALSAINQQVANRIRQMYVSLIDIPYVLPSSPPSYSTNTTSCERDGICSWN
jgi:hypothetical protein